MSHAICSIEGCEKPTEARGWCQAHYWRWKRHGDPIGGNTCYTSPAESFVARTEWRGDCLIWTGSMVHGGYGQIWANGRKVRAHRYAWEQAYGPIPEGSYVDHTCHNRACVNAQHLRLASPSENEQNRAGATRVSRTGVRNVSVMRGGRFIVSAKKAGEVHFGGTFDRLEDAAISAENLRLELFGTYAGPTPNLTALAENGPTEKES